MAPLVLILLPADFFDHGPSVCPSRLLLDLSCPGCGITRGIMHLIHFEFSLAWEYNKLSYIVLPVLFLIWLKFTVELIFQKKILKFLR